jgi:hypothetical protein
MLLNNNTLSSSNLYLKSLDTCLALWAGARETAVKALRHADLIGQFVEQQEMQPSFFLSYMSMWYMVLNVKGWAIRSRCFKSKLGVLRPKITK